MYEISSMETRREVTERVSRPEHGDFTSYDEAKKYAEGIGDPYDNNYLPWPV